MPAQRRALFCHHRLDSSHFRCLHPYYVDNSGASAAPVRWGEDASLVQFLPSFGRRHCLIVVGNTCGY